MRVAAGRTERVTDERSMDEANIRHPGDGAANLGKFVADVRGTNAIGVAAGTSRFIGFVRAVANRRQASSRLEGSAPRQECL